MKIVADVAATNTEYSDLFVPRRITHPMPFFGDPTTAQFATIGVNPSADEFGSGRWPSSVTVQELDARCVNYFSNPVPPNDWFHGYEDPVNKNKALNILGHSYMRDTVHLDLSPRPTISMGTLSKTPVLRTLFLKMASTDMQWFLSALALCSNLKAAIMSGSVTNAHYFDEFLRKHMPSGYTLKLRLRSQSDGEPRRCTT